MKAFWWFRENKIAGMARPGFNHAHWFDLPFDEATVLGWLGRYSGGSVSLKEFEKHLQDYVPKIQKFYSLDEEVFRAAIRDLETPTGFRAAFERLRDRTHAFEGIEVRSGEVRFSISDRHFRSETEYLKKQGIQRIVSLTEQHHQNELLADHFDLHHIGIEDLGPPKMEQVHELVRILRISGENRETVAVHCLAGIGRTSTMLMAAHIVMAKVQMSWKNSSKSRIRRLF